MQNKAIQHQYKMLMPLLSSGPVIKTPQTNIISPSTLQCILGESHLGTVPAESTQWHARAFRLGKANLRNRTRLFTIAQVLLEVKFQKNYTLLKVQICIKHL